MGSPRRGQPRLTWAMIRRVTAVRVCGPGVSGTLSMMAVAGRSRAAGAAWRWCRLACAAAAYLPDARAGRPPVERGSADARDATLPFPASLASLLAAFGPVFTAPSFRTFCGLACGFVAQTGKRTVCGMLAGAGLARL